jgi:hypothetical protein
MTHIFLSRGPSCPVGQSGRLLLALASAVILGSKSYRTHDYIYLSVSQLGIMQLSSPSVSSFGRSVHHSWFQVWQDSWPYFNDPGSHAASLYVLLVGQVNWCWALPAQSFLVLSLAALKTIFYCLITLGVVPLLSVFQSVCLVNFWWPLPAQLFLVLSPMGLMTMFYCLMTGSHATAPCNFWLTDWLKTQYLEVSLLLDMYPLLWKSVYQAIA